MDSLQTIGRIVQLNSNPHGGVPKYPVPTLEVTHKKVIGDKQNNLKYHGGPTRAVSLYSLEQIQALQAEGHPIAPGTTGENVTITGLDWENIQVGDRLKLGDWVELEVTDYAAPCKKIIESFSEGRFTRISQKLHPGWSRIYTSVISAGEIQVGDIVEWIPRGAAVPASALPEEQPA